MQDNKNPVPDPDLNLQASLHSFAASVPFTVPGTGQLRRGCIIDKVTRDELSEVTS
jgi:hypothetical protein